MRTPLEWDAATYDRVAAPQRAWAREVLDRLSPRGDERVLDAGCGSGGVTRMLAERVPDGSVIAVDGSAAMVARARENLADLGIEVQQQDLVELTLDAPVDLVFSNAVFHHIHDHEALFGAIRRALDDRGRLVAQCGGDGNIAHFRRRADAVAARDPYAELIGEMPAPWNYATPRQTEQRLRAAGFSQAHCTLEPKPTVLDEPEAFLATVVCNYHLERLPQQLHEAFVADVIAECGRPVELDYVRLNIEASA